MKVTIEGVALAADEGEAWELAKCTIITIELRRRGVEEYMST
jgi:hypothetical protein